MSYVVTMKGQDFNDLATAANFAAKDRPILNAVKFHLVGDTMTATATDSFKLVTIKRDIVVLSRDYATMEELIIPSAVLLKALKSFKPVRSAYSDVKLTVNEDKTFTISSNGDVIGGELITYGTYPDVSKVIPNATGISETESIAFDPTHLAQFAKVAPFNSKNAVSRSMVIKTIRDKASPMLIESSDAKTVIVVMPVRLGN